MLGLISEWEDTLFKDAIEINPSYTLKKGGRFKKISMANLEPFVRRPSNYEVAKFNGGSKFKNGDTLVARITPCLENGKTCYVDILTDEEVGFGSTEFIVLRGREGISDNVYVYYLALLPEFRNICIKSMMGTSGRQRAQIDAIANWRFRIPKIGEQKEIATLLSSLDDKIELNRQMNRTLEAIAQALFKSWFVDFDPVWAKKEGRQPFGMDADTAALFPDEFEESELGLIPAGWNVGCIGDIVASIRNSTDPSILDSGVPYIGLEHMPQQSIALDRWSKAATVKSLKLQFNRNDILFGKLRPYFHKVGIAPIDGVCSSDILVLRPKQPSYLGFALGFLSSTELIDYAAAISTGTRMPRVSWQDISAYPIVIPPLSTIQRFMLIAAPMLERLSHNIMESRILTEIRDTLLPKLLSGELRVPTATESVLSQEVTLHDA